MLRSSLWALESRKQNKHNVCTHCLTSTAAAPQRQTKALKNQSFSLKLKQTQTQRNTNTKKDARKTLENRPHARTAPTSPSWGAPKPSGEGEPTNRRLNGTGGAPHGAKRLKETKRYLQGFKYGSSWVQINTQIENRFTLRGDIAT